MSKKNIVNITSSALFQLTKIAKEHSSKSFLFSIKGGGCSGFTYKLTPTNNAPNKLDEILCLKNKITKLSGKNDTPLESIHVCGKSLMHVFGTEIDWQNDIMGQTFKFNNPIAASSCGCGTSFKSFK